MAAKRTAAEKRQLDELLSRDHTLNGAILFGLEGYVVEMQARAMRGLYEARLAARAVGWLEYVVANGTTGERSPINTFHKFA